MPSSNGLQRRHLQHYLVLLLMIRLATAVLAAILLIVGLAAFITGLAFAADVGSLQTGRVMHQGGPERGGTTVQLRSLQRFHSAPYRREEFTAGALDRVSLEALPTQDRLLYLPLAASGQPRVRISALYYDALLSGEPEEAFQVWNVSAYPVDLVGYQVSDGRRAVTFPRIVLQPGTGLWCTQDAAAFRRVFGEVPGCEYGSDSDPGVPDTTGSVLRFANSGGQVSLTNPSGTLVDVLAYAGGETDLPGWRGPALGPYSPSNSFPAEGQVLYRKRHWLTGQPVPDTGTRADWAQDPNDSFGGRRVRYPGWDMELLAHPDLFQARGMITVALAPDNLFSMASDVLASARHSIRIAAYTFEHVALAELLADRARSGVSVTMLLEGSPVGGLQEQQRYAVQLIEDAGGQVWYMVDDRNGASHDRYAYHHAKYAIVDDRLLLISTENFSPDGMPDDDKTDGTQGRRGVGLVVDDPGLVTQALTLFQADLAPDQHVDLFRWTASDPKYGAPAPGFVPATESGGTGYALVHPAPLAVTGVFSAELAQAPEGGLWPPEHGGLLGLVAQAEAGDVVLVEQLYEREHWGAASDTPATAPNVRLVAYLDAARRGAQVRVLLDGLFDRGQNTATAAYLAAVARSEGLDLVVRLGNPTMGGLHAKLVLVEVGGRGWVHAGSLNGSEASAKVNRELTVQVQSDPVHAYLSAAFWHDWDASADGEGQELALPE